MIRYSKEKPGKEVHDEKESIQPDALGRGGAGGRRAGAPAGHEPLGAGEPHPVRVRLRPHAGAQDIFEAIEALVSPSRELVPFFAPNSQSMSLKSSLAYKYRPTVKYEVDLGGGEDTLGTLNVVFRTQSAELIAALTDFFRLWARIENACLAPALGGTIACSLYDGRFVRPLAMPRGHARSVEDIAGAISAYVQLFDRLLKGYLSGDLSAKDVELAYRGDLRGRGLLI